MVKATIKYYINLFRKFIFILRGKKPWSYGYSQYKFSLLKKYIYDSDFDIKNLSLGHGYRLDERSVEYPWLFSNLKNENGNLLDAGSVLNYELFVDHPKLTSKNIFISTLAPENYCFWRKNISYIYEDFRDSCFRNEFFDTIVCISTLEHVGMDNTLLYTTDKTKLENDKYSCLDAVKEMNRILKQGGTLFLSVPYGEYKNHGWFQIFDEEMVMKIISVFEPSKVTECYYQYTEHGWIYSNKDSSRNCTYFDINKNNVYDADYAAASRAVVCLELIK